MTAEEMVEKYTAAEAAVLEGKSVQWNGRTLTRENLQEIRAGRREWERRVALEKRGGSIRRVVRFV